MKFWFHYNKPESRKRGLPVLSLHFKGKCHMVHDLNVSVPIQSRVRKTQPHIVMVGNARDISVHDGSAYCYS